MNAVALFDSFAKLLSYPAAQYVVDAESCLDLARQVDPEAAKHLARFVDVLKTMSFEEWQELYVRTFDLNPICALEVGWQLFGDNYDRGEFLVKMRSELSSHGVPEWVELPDHLSHALALYPRMEEGQARDFAVRSVLPALRRMLAGMEGQESPYEDVLRAVTRMLEVQYAEASKEVNHG